MKHNLFGWVWLISGVILLVLGGKQAEVQVAVCIICSNIYFSKQ